MRASLSKLLLTAFGLCALVSMTNVACSTASEVDSGTSENLTGGHPYGTVYGGYGVSYGSSVYGAGYGFGVNLAEDSAP